MRRSVMVWSLLTPLLAACGSDFGAVGVDKLTYHNSAYRDGANDHETQLTPQVVSGPQFGEIWQSEELDSFGETPPRLFASPLYVHALKFTQGPFTGQRLPVAYVVSSTGYAYAILARDTDNFRAGHILWRKRLTQDPCQNGQFGNLSTPVIDLDARRIYVTSCRGTWVWDVHALDLETGATIAGWPLEISHRTVTPDVNRNGTTRFSEGQYYFQRGALNMSPQKDRLYIPFGPDQMGWLISIDTVHGRIHSAFSSMPRDDMEQGGMWGASGAAVDDAGRIHIATGASYLSALQKRGIPGVYPDAAHAWGQSLMQLRDDPQKGLRLIGTYSPYNYCQTAAADIDIASSGAVLFDIGAGTKSSGRMLAMGAGKQGVAYLLDRSALPGGVTKRKACSTNPETDGSLLAPEVQSEYGKRGPTVIFGPFSDNIGMVNSAKSRATLAHYRNSRGQHYLFFAGSTKAGADFSENVPPGLVRVKVVIQDGRQPYLKIDRKEMTQVLQNPGSPVVSSNRGRDGIVWVLDPNVPRSVDIYQRTAPGARLYAFDAESLKLLWHSGDSLHTSGKYNEPAVVDGMVLVGTDRLQAFSRGGARGGLSGTGASSAAGNANDGEALFGSTCLSCHGAGVSGAPSPAALGQFSEARIVEALTTGKMKEMGAGLSPAQRQAIAGYLRGGNKK